MTRSVSLIDDRLREGGWNEEQARALCDVLREIMRGVAMSSELGRVESSMSSELERVESSLSSELERVESSLRGELKIVTQVLEGQMASLRLMILVGFGFLGLLVTLVGILVAFWGGV